MVEKSRKLRAKNFWRKNRRLITLIALASILGVAIAGLNLWHHQNTIEKFTLEEPREIGNQKTASFTFNLTLPQAASETTVKLRFMRVPESPLSVMLNGEEIKTVSGKEILISVPTESLEEKNTVTVRRTGIRFQQQKLVAAQVTSYTKLQQMIFVLLNLASIVLIFTPIGYLKYEEYVEKQKIEEEFPVFLRDVVEGTRAGMSLPQAIQNTETGSYGPLDERIEKMSAQIEWGVPFDEVLNNFGDDVDSALIRRSVDTIIQAYTSGGNIQDVLDSVGENIRSIKKLKQERQSQLYGEMITGYVVYFIFIGILIALTTFLLPNLATASQSLGGSSQLLGGGGGNLQQNISLYNVWFKRLVYIQAIFSGIIIGKLAEGDLSAGLKHSAILFALGYLAVTFFL